MNDKPTWSGTGWLDPVPPFKEMKPLFTEPSGSGSEPPANPDPISPASMELAEKLRKSRWAHPEHDTGCLTCGQTFLKAQGHQCGSGSSPVGPLQELRLVIEDMRSPAAYAALVSVEEQLAALQRERDDLANRLYAANGNTMQRHAEATGLRTEVARLREREKLTREALAELERIRLSVNKQYPSSGLHGTADFLVGELMSSVLLTFAPLRAALASSLVPSAPQTPKGDA